MLEFINYESMLGAPTLFRYAAMVCYPTSLLRIAIAVASLQLCWTRWRNRSRMISDELIGLSPKRFFEACLVLASLVVTGIPAIQAFVFTLWLGPFNIRSLFGY